MERIALVLDSDSPSFTPIRAEHLTKGPRGMTSFPNLFILGAPKCGTTALSNYLAGHPNIFMSETRGWKELNFFNTDINLHLGARRISDLQNYSDLFADLPASKVYLGEASPLYLYSREAIPAILEACEDPRFIVMLRSPLEIAQGLHNQHAKNGLDELDFELAWNLQGERRLGRHLPSAFSDGNLLQYGAIAQVGIQLERLFAWGGRDRTYLIVYDDFEHDQAVCYRNLLTWLGLADDGRANFPRLNPSVDYRWPTLETRLRHLRRLRIALGIKGGLGVHSFINKLNVVIRRESLRPGFHQTLCNYFREDIAALSALTGRDFSNWLT